MSRWIEISIFLALCIETEASESVPIELLLLEDIILFICGVELGFWFSSSRSDRGVFVPSCLTIVIFDLGVDFEEASDAAFAISMSRILFCNVFKAKNLSSVQFISQNLPDITARPLLSGRPRGEVSPEFDIFLI